MRLNMVCTSESSGKSWGPPARARPGPAEQALSGLAEQAPSGLAERERRQAEHVATSAGPQPIDGGEQFGRARRQTADENAAARQRAGSDRDVAPRREAREDGSPERLRIVPRDDDGGEVRPALGGAEPARIDRRRCLEDEPVAQQRALGVAQGDRAVEEAERPRLALSHAAGRERVDEDEHGAVAQAGGDALAEGRARERD